MHKPESYLENEMHKILWDFKVQRHHIILTRRSDLVLKKIAVLWIFLFWQATDWKGSEKTSNYSDLVSELKNCGMWE